MTNENDNGNDLTDLFGPVISSYSREQAIADGVLVDMQAGDFQEITSEHFGACPVVMTAAVAALIAKAVAHPRMMNDLNGVVHDIFHMAKIYGLKNVEAGGSVLFKVIITGCGRVRNHILKAAFDGEALTIMQRCED